MFKRSISPRDSLGLGSVSSEFISNEHIEVMKIIIEEHPQVIFCGSIGLVIKGLLKRPVKDIDVLTPENYYRDPGAFFPEYRIYNGNTSHNFPMGDDDVYSFKIVMNGISVDVLYNNSDNPPKFSEKGFYGDKIKMEDPMGAINAKLQYIQIDQNISSFRKHLTDLLEMDVPKSRIIESLKASAKYKCLTNKKNSLPKNFS